MRKFNLAMMAGSGNIQLTSDISNGLRQHASHPVRGLQGTSACLHCLVQGDTGRYDCSPQHCADVIEYRIHRGRESMNPDESQGPTIGASDAFTVLTYNVGNGLAEATRLASFVLESGADIVGLQEIDVQQAAALNDMAADIYPYRILRGSGFAGRGLLSKYPILDEEWHELSPGRPDLRVVLDLSCRPTTVVVAHPPPPRLRKSG